MRYANGVTNLYQYDARNRLTSLAWQSGGTALASFAYSVGPTGNRTSLTETVGIGATPRAYNWAYDYLYRMTGESIGGLGAVGYGFDTVGNRLSRSSNVSGISSNTAAYTANDWLTNDLANSLYDSDGNTTNSSGVAYRYDSLNHLTNVNNGQSIIITYDGDGNRVSKKVGSGTTTYYLVDSANPSGYAQVLEEYQGANLSRVYNYGLALISQRQATSGTVSYFGTDGHGSARFLMDVNGNVTDTYTFDAYGLLISSTGNSTPNNYLYCGQQWDGDFGMYYLRARYYQPNTGRFWSMDTYDGNSEDPLSLHKYLYCEADPVNGVDPSGFNVEIHTTIGSEFNVLTGRTSGQVFSVLTCKAFINQVQALPNGCISFIGFYGHGGYASQGISDDVNETESILLYRGGQVAFDGPSLNQQKILLVSVLAGKMAPGASILLGGCSTAAANATYPNMPNICGAISLVMPGVTVSGSWFTTTDTPNMNPLEHSSYTVTRRYYNTSPYISIAIPSMNINENAISATLF